jgi:uncharacterized protein
MYRPAGYQKWSNLAFIHWRVPAGALRELLPPPLSLDTWQAEAWLGMVAFDMSGIRPWWSPAVPYLCAFPETNLRTYVHLGSDPGVWFFSLDASRWLAVQAARWGWGLNYRWSRMQVRCSRDPSNPATTVATSGSMDECRTRSVLPTSMEYFSRRNSGPDARVDLRLEIESVQAPRQAALDSLEHFLCERYLLYTLYRGRLMTARVHHAPYPLVDAHVTRCHQSLTDTIGCRVKAADHVLFSPGVQVEVYPLHPAAECS